MPIWDKHFGSEATIDENYVSVFWSTDEFCSRFLRGRRKRSALRTVRS